jgi:GH35 family endo-1,4-beta-xylanase
MYTLVPVLAVLVSLLCLAGCHRFQNTPTPKGNEESWLAKANRRIAKHRMGTFTVEVVDSQGRPIPGAPVRAEMTRHAFRFGTAINAETLLESDEEDFYRLYIRKLFNHATVENRLKWRAQSDPENIRQADEAIRWLETNEIGLHAHAMIWASFKYGAMPKDLEAKLKSQAPDRARIARQRSLEHIAEVARRYRGKAVEWDVVNEQHSENEITKVVHPGTDPAKAPLLVEWLQAAREADPQAELLVNDFGILVGDDEEHKASFERMIRFLVESGAPLDAAGFQAHYTNAWQRRSPEQLWKTLERFANLGVDLQITEFDMWGAGWGQGQREIERNQADYLRTFYTLCFSHPCVTGITMWGFWDGRQWMDAGPLFREDWTPKAGYCAYWDLVHNQWWTLREGHSDAQGRFRFRGFYGDYRLALGEEDVQIEASAEFRQSRTLRITLPSGGEDSPD